MLHPVAVEHMLRYEHERFLREAARRRLIREAEGARRRSPAKDEILGRNGATNMQHGGSPPGAAIHPEHSICVIGAGQTHRESLTTQPSTLDAPVKFTPMERRALSALRYRFGRERDLFSDHERAHLRFLRWLYRVGRLTL